uniref:Trafficking protein particle complex subunit 2-like protein n=1 Tax=Rhinopithecus bieti TaxID=61621 RepID=A0A2K6MGT0_RHIBE
MAVCIAVIAKENYPLYIRSTPTENELKFHYMVHTSLDVVDEKISAMGKALVDQRELYLGLLYPTEDYKVYGYVTNSKVKFVMVVDSSNTALRDNEIRSVGRGFAGSFSDVGPTSCVRIQSRWAVLSVSCSLLSVGPALPFRLPKCNHLENKGGKVFLSYEHHPPKTPRAEVLKPQSPVFPHQLLHRSPARKVDRVCVVRRAELAHLASQVCPVGTWGTCRTQGQAHGQWLSGITHPLVTT